MKKLISLLPILILFASCSKDTSYEGGTPAADTVVKVIHDTTVKQPLELTGELKVLFDSNNPSSIVCTGSGLTLGTQGVKTYPDFLKDSILGAQIKNAFVYNEGEAYAQPDYLTSLISSNINIHKVNGENIAIAWEVAEDVLDNRTSDETAYTRFTGYCTSLQQSGWKVVVLSVPYLNTAPTFGDFTPSGYSADEYMAQIDRINDSLRTNWKTFASGFVDVRSDARFSKCDPKYYQSNKMDLTDSGNAAIASLVYQYFKQVKL